MANAHRLRSPFCRAWAFRPLALLAIGAVGCLSAPLFAGPPDLASSPSQEHALALVREAWDRPGAEDPRRPQRLRELPIGIFDSGTGGLAVLDEVLRVDGFENRTGRALGPGDGQPDFACERFVFLADQANMPYGNYPALGRTRFLHELAVCDAAFLLGARYFRRTADAIPACDKRPVKAIAIACNTATAYAQADLEALAAQAKVPVTVLGVIEAGAEGAVESLDGRASIGVLATQGTASSSAYPAAIQSLAQKRGLAGRLPVFQQGSLGLAGAVDSAPEFLAAGAIAPRPAYRGPSLENPLARIDRRLLPRYDLDFTAGRMLVEGDRQNPGQLQLNSLENYVAYDVVSLLETIRTSPDVPPLGAIVLGCTHFPYVADLITAKLQRLRDYQEQGRYVYRPYLREHITLIDPARRMARKLYQLLRDQGKLAALTAIGHGQTRGEFYITTAWPGPFTYQHKYGRSDGYTGSDIRTVPLLTEGLDPPTAARLRHRVPAAWHLLDDFSRHSAKAASPPHGL